MNPVNHLQQPHDSPSRPNLLYIHTDQHNPFVTGCYGDPVVATPNLDRLAAGGAIFDATYCCSPICVPSRMSMLTGRHPYQNQVWTNLHGLDSAIPTLPHALGAAGYRSVLAGRMHVRGPDQLHGYADRLVGDHNPNYIGGTWNDMGVLVGTETPVRKTVQTSGPGQVAYQIHDEEVTAAAVNFLNQYGVQQRAGQAQDPFSLSVGYMLPHPPYVPRRADFERYAGRVPMPRKPIPFEQVSHPFLRLWRQHTHTEAVTEAEVVNTRTAYWALVDVVDRMVGQVLDALRANGLAENTLVVYTSDHGDMLGEQSLWWKHLFYEESIRVPLILSWPGVIPPHQRCDRVVSALDVNATMLDALDAPALPGSPGRSLMGLVSDRPTTRAVAPQDWQDTAYAEYCEDQYSPPGGCYHRMVRQNEWKLIYYHGYAPQLFNLQEDPDELVDRAGDPATHAICRELTAQVLREWDPVAIQRRMAEKRADNRILTAWAETVQPPDRFRWTVTPEMNYLEPPS